MDAVWSAITDPLKIQQWFGWQYDGLEAEIQQIFVDGGTPDAERHALTWPTGDEMTLHSDNNGTLLSTFRPTPNADPMREQADDIDEGWIAFTEQLRFWLERHPGEERATIYLSGAARSEYRSVAEALGLPESGTVGRNYEADVATGERLTGTVWSQQGNVTALTVDTYGDVLVVLTDHDAQRQAPNGGGMVVITTFGLSEDQLTQLKNRWVAAWESKYEPSSEFGAATSS
jgi:hypothetical protein